MGPHDLSFDFLPVIRGRIEEGAGLMRDAGRFQIMDLERSPVRLSPSCILPRMTGEEDERQGRYARLRSSVSGCSGLSIGLGSGMSPGEWPIGKKRARRRASASLALTGMRS